LSCGQATDEAAKAQQLLAERQQLMTQQQQLLAEREKQAQDYQHLKQKYAHKSAAIKEVRQPPRDTTSVMNGARTAIAAAAQRCTRLPQCWCPVLLACCGLLASAAAWQAEYN
jgi:ElaB/YqjD/DUF883 family membrane-anchored ribosome-binding protein